MPTSAPISPPTAPPTPTPAKAPIIGPAAMSGPTPGIARDPIPASQPGAPPSKPPVLAPVAVPSGPFVFFSCSHSLLPALFGLRTGLRLFRSLALDHALTHHSYS